MKTVKPGELVEFLLHVASVRPVFIWGPPGIGKSSLVEQFAMEVGIDVVTLLAPEDLIGVPQIVEGKSRFCPPEQIARDEPYLLFLDELNASSTEVQKAFLASFTTGASEITNCTRIRSSSEPEIASTTKRSRARCRARSLTAWFTLN